MTEMITGVDLIQEQIRAAQGEVLRFKQEDIQIKARALRQIWHHDLAQKKHAAANMLAGR